MNSLEEKVKAVRGVFEVLDQKIIAFQLESTLHCKVGCGKCCVNPDIEATTLEFLPFADQVYKEGKSGAWLDILTDANISSCALLDSKSIGVGHCTQYLNRGLICRLFGFSARTNKYGKKEIVTCKTIKSGQPEAYESNVSKIIAGEVEIAVMSDYYRQLQSIDYEMTREFLPINLAIRSAIHQVMHYYAYRDYISEIESACQDPMGEIEVG